MSRQRKFRSLIPYLHPRTDKRLLKKWEILLISVPDAERLTVAYLLENQARYATALKQGTLKPPDFST